MTITPFAPKAPLGRRWRVAAAAQRFMVRIGALPTAEKLGDLPMQQRLKMQPPGWAVPKPDARVKTQNRVIPGRHGDIPVRVYRPAAGNLASVAVLYLHGGGWMTGGLESLDWFCREICARGNHVVVSVQYRLTPQFPYPVPLDDCQDALTWLAKNLGELGATEIVVAGDSAGGNLTAALSLRTLRQNGPTIRNQVLIYPALDATLSAPSHRQGTSALTYGEMVVVADAYRGQADASTPEISPLLDPDKADLPPTLILTAEYDSLRDDGDRYAAGLKQAGVHVTHIEYAGVDHGFLSLPKLTKKATQAATNAVLGVLR